MRQKTVLFFGAGIYQVSLIKAAKDLGVISIAIDPNENAPGGKYADYFYIVEGKDYEQTKQIALKHKVDAFVTGQMEKPLMMMAELAQELSIPFMKPEVIKRSQNKWLMKQAFVANNIPCAKGYLIKKTEELNDLKANFPFIIKPTDSSSSRGVLKVNDLQDLSLSLNATKSVSSDEKIIIEEFLDGKEYSAESITFNGETFIVQITEKFISPYPYTVETGHLQPAQLSATEKEQIELLVTSAIKAIGIDNSASHAEVMLTKDGPKMIEIGARLGGDFIASYLTLASSGVNMDRAAIQVALGIKPDVKKIINQYSYIKYFNLPEGSVVEKILPFDNVINNPYLVFSHIFVKPGDTIPKVTHSAQRSGCFIVSGESRDEVLQLAERYAKEIQDCIVFT